MLFDESVMKSLLPQIIAIAREAAAAIMSVYADPSIAVMSKDDHSPLTQADLAAHNIICLGLNNLDLGWPVLTEESAKIPFEERKHWQRFWLVDPLDGTKEFIKRNGEFTVNIALIENGVPILGRNF